MPFTCFIALFLSAVAWASPIELAPAVVQKCGSLLVEEIGVAAENEAPGICFRGDFLSNLKNLLTHSGLDRSAARDLAARARSLASDLDGRLPSKLGFSRILFSQSLVLCVGALGSHSKTQFTPLHVPFQTTDRTLFGQAQLGKSRKRYVNAILASPPTSNLDNVKNIWVEELLTEAAKHLVIETTHYWVQAGRRLQTLAEIGLISNAELLDALAVQRHLVTWQGRTPTVDSGLMDLILISVDAVLNAYLDIQRLGSVPNAEKLAFGMLENYRDTAWSAWTARNREYEGKVPVTQGNILEVGPYFLSEMAKLIHAEKQWRTRILDASLN